MGKESKRGRRTAQFLVATLIILLGVWSWVFFFTHTFQPWWKTLTKESRRILGWERYWVSPEEKRIREEVILKKMEEANAERDWRSLAPEYPRPKKLDPLTGEERMKVLKNSSEFKKMDKELKEYVKEKADLLNPDPPIPPLRDVTDLTRLKDKGAEKIIEGLLSKSERTPQEKPLEENLMLGIKGPLTYRKILERPSLPSVKVKMEAEIEVTLYVLPNGLVDRAIPSIKGDAELERIALHYLKQWRFVPLPNDQPQVEQWGVIPIKFKLQ